ncbi:hypothetical protein R5R35_001734 [Gryllus longicercus]|uniref:Peroxidase n=1 Tax=Gryllus longicercus TaxID=2509291 RepID=A0AAN9W0F2_9ORTH
MQRFVDAAALLLVLASFQSTPVLGGHGHHGGHAGFVVPTSFGYGIGGDFPSIFGNGGNKYGPLSSSLVSQSSGIGFGDVFKGSPLNVLGSFGQQQCPQVPGPCNNGKYRTFDGSCNNLHNPTWGMAMTTYNRVKPAKYADGIQVPPTSVTGKQLPPSRLVSHVLFPDAEINDPKWTLAAMQWGQIITHDMSMAAGTTQAKAHATRCCTADGSVAIPKQYAAPSCFPIILGPHDPVYSKVGQQCMNFVRTTTDISSGCAKNFKPAEQLTAVTHYLDASLVYGSTPQAAAQLREGRKGRLITEIRHGKIYPPSAPNKTAACDHMAEDEPCYLAGDQRVNQNTQLTVLQIILLREHNRVANALAHINPHWDDETLYQEARRIVIAEHQHISYYEWLPIFLGWENTRRHGLTYGTHGYTNDYDPHVDPSVLNGHATAAFRYFHSAIQGFLKLVGEHRESYEALRLSDHFNRPEVIEQGDNMDKLIRGLATQPQQAVDQYFTSEITKFLFRNGRPFGQDLRAIDIQRGRDHGLASYNDYRHFCGLPKARSFEDFGDYISRENVAKLAKLYAHPDDVDFTVGGSLEAHVEGTLSGPTFLCVLVEQFYRTRVGDRYFYENGEKHHSFSLEQLNEIRKASISRLFCDNGDEIYSMQPKGFKKLSPGNQIVPCHDYDSIPVVNLELWRDSHTHHFDYKK